MCFITINRLTCGWYVRGKAKIHKNKMYKSKSFYLKIELQLSNKVKITFG